MCDSLTLVAPGEGTKTEGFPLTESFWGMPEAYQACGGCLDLKFREVIVAGVMCYLPQAQKALRKMGEMMRALGQQVRSSLGEEPVRVNMIQTQH